MQTILFVSCLNKEIGVEGGNCPRGGKARGATVQGAIILGGNWPRGNCPGGELTRGELSRGQLTYGGIVLGGIVQGGIGGGNCPGEIVRGGTDLITRNGSTKSGSLWTSVVIPLYCRTTKVFLNQVVKIKATVPQ